MALQNKFQDVLTKVGLKYMQDPANFQASKIFPACPVMKLSGEFPTYPKEYWMKNEAAKRKPGTVSAGSAHGRGSDTYECEDISFHEDVPDEYVNNDAAPLNPLKAATTRVTQKIAIFDEVDFSTRFFTTGIWTAGTAPSTKWDAANSTPLEDVDGWKRTQKIATGLGVDTAVMSEGVYDVLKRHSQVKDQIKYTSAANVTPELLARILEVDRLIILNAVYDSAAYGATAAQAYIAGDHFMLLKTTNSPSLEEASAGYNFVWNGYGSNGYGVRTFYREEPMATRVEAHHYHQMKQLASDLGTYVDAPLT